MRFDIHFILFLIFYTPLSKAEIYKWVDEQGVTHYSERQSQTQDAQEISEKLKKNGNVVKFNVQGDIEFYKPPQKSKPALVTVDIQLIDYQLASGKAKEIDEKVGAIYQTYSRLFGWSPNPKRAINIKIFGNYAAFEKYQKEVIGSKHAINRSHYISSRREVLMLGTEFENNTMHTLLHESSHAILHMELNRIPKWINEGLAEVFEYIQSNGNDITIGYNRGWLEIIKQKQQEGSLRSFEENLMVSDLTWHNESARVERSYYNIAWSMMRFMLSTQEGITAVRHSMQTCKKIVCWQSAQIVEQFAQSYPGGMQQIDKDWRRWIEEF